MEGFLFLAAGGQSIWKVYFSLQPSYWLRFS